jgi:eukaryotic-like serine/threonine-protein kinase
MYKEAVSRMTESWRNWEGQVVDGRFPLQRYLGGRTRTAVFTTKAEGDASQRQAIRIVVADAKEAQELLQCWDQASKLSHPSLVRIFQTGTARLGSLDVAYVVTDYADEDLSQVLPERALTTGETREVLEGAVDVLAYLHGKGFVHARIKPSNIMAVNNQLKLSSDGLFRIGDRRPATLAGTAYDAPETFREPFQPSADFWSLGVTVVETLTQVLPNIDRHKNTDPSLQKLPAPFSEIARHCLMTDSRLRWGAAEIREHLRTSASAAADAAAKPIAVSKPAAEPKPVAAPRVVAPSTSPLRGRVPVKLIAGLIGMVALLIIALLLRKPHTNGPDAEEPIRTTVQSGKAAVNPSAESQPGASARTPESSNTSGSSARELPKRAAATKPAAGASSISDSGVPGIVKKVMPNPSQSARDTIQGTIRVGVHVTADDAGNVVQTELATPGPSRYFAGLATKAAQQWKFASASEGVAPREWLLHFEFRRKGTSVRPEPVH